MDIKLVEVNNFRKTPVITNNQCKYSLKKITFKGNDDTLDITSGLIKTDNLSLKNAISPKAKKMIFPFLKTAEKTGNEIFLYGGFVRDLLTGSPFNDIDFLVSGDVNNFFSRFLNDNKSSNIEYIMRGYNHPDMKEYKKIKLKFNENDFDINPLAVWQTKDLTMEEVLYKRAKACDFTISSMMIKPFFDKDGEMGFKFIDPLNAYGDMQNRKLKLADEKGQLFEENPERIIQALRLKKKYNATYDVKLQQEIAKYLHHPTFQKDKMYYFRLKRGLKGLLKDNGSIITTIKDIIKNKLYRLF